jgi:hypothetical protein
VTFKTVEIPAFSGWIIAVIVSLIHRGRGTELHFSLCKFFSKHFGVAHNDNELLKISAIS